MRYYFKHKREKTSQCNICLSEAKLTWDHIPPQGGIDLSEVEQKSIMQHLTSTSNHSIFSQNGVKYRTICSDCNNRLLGAKYDIALNSFANELGSFLKSSLQLPHTVMFKTQPGLILKGLIGHLLAAKGEIPSSKIDEQFREYFLSEEICIPKDFRVFYWIYPYDSIKIIRDVGMPSIRGDFQSGFSIFSTLKYFPIAYLVTEAKQYSGLHEMTSYCTGSIYDYVEIPINLSEVHKENWPEHGRDNILMGGESLNSGVSAVPRRKTKLK